MLLMSSECSNICCSVGLLFNHLFHKLIVEIDMSMDGQPILPPRGGHIFCLLSCGGLLATPYMHSLGPEAQHLVQQPDSLSLAGVVPLQGQAVSVTRASFGLDLLPASSPSLSIATVYSYGVLST